MKKNDLLELYSTAPTVANVLWDYVSEKEDENTY